MVSWGRAGTKVVNLMLTQRPMPMPRSNMDHIGPLFSSKVTRRHMLTWIRAWSLKGRRRLLQGRREHGPPEASRWNGQQPMEWGRWPRTRRPPRTPALASHRICPRELHPRWMRTGIPIKTMTAKFQNITIIQLNVQWVMILYSYFFIDCLPCFLTRFPQKYSSYWRAFLWLIWWSTVNVTVPHRSPLPTLDGRFLHVIISYPYL